MAHTAALLAFIAIGALCCPQSAHAQHAEALHYEQLAEQQHVRVVAAEDSLGDADEEDAAVEWEHSTDEGSFLSKPSAEELAALTQHARKDMEPELIKLRRESVPVMRNGKVASYKTTYSGFINVAMPDPQEFRVVFDTGSGHIVLPSVECQSEACLTHRRYNMSNSLTSRAINVDGSSVKPGETCDEVTIGYGTGQVTGEFAKDWVCLGQASDRVNPETGLKSRGLCVDAAVILATEMSRQPFKYFAFDGIVGLGLKSLSLQDGYSFFEVLSASGKLKSPLFAVFLSAGDDGEEHSELAVGGYNPKRLVGSLSWAPVVNPDAGYWMVKILAFKIDGVAHELCADGTCKAVVDTGTSHLGVPIHQGFFDELTDTLTRPGEGMEDCREKEGGANLEIDVEGEDGTVVSLPLITKDYMRQIPLEEGVTVGSKSGVSMRQHAINVTLRTNRTNSSSATEEPEEVEPEVPAIPIHCRPRLMKVSLPAPLGPKLFIMGEVVFHHYYSVYDWEKTRVGFGVASHKQTQKASDEEATQRIHEAQAAQKASEETPKAVEQTPQKAKAVVV